MTRFAIPATPRQLTPEWLTQVLTAGGVLRGGSVIAADWERVGEDYGFTGLVGRLELRYDGVEGDPPSSLVAKLPLARGAAVSGHRAQQERDPELRARYYDRAAKEVRFYREIGASFAPEHYHAAADDKAQQVVLLLEDLTGGRQGDVLRGCSVEDARLVLRELASFHACWWRERAPTAAFPRTSRPPQTRQERFSDRADLFLERYGARLPPEACKLIDRLRKDLGRVATTLDDGAQTLVHGDLHLDNLIFDARGARSVTVLDWQTVAVGHPAWDVALFLYGSVAPEDRRAAEGVLLEEYAAMLHTYGVRGYSADDARRDCRLALLLLVAGTINGIASLDPTELSERERALHEAVFDDDRLVTALLDHGEAALAAA